MTKVLSAARYDLHALQTGGVDAVMFSNEFSLPYLTKVRPETVAAMARVIGELMDEITVPFGVNCLWDPVASLDLCRGHGRKIPAGNHHRGVCLRFWNVEYQRGRNGPPSGGGRR